MMVLVLMEWTVFGLDVDSNHRDNHDYRQ